MNNKRVRIMIESFVSIAIGVLEGGTPVDHADVGV